MDTYPAPNPSNIKKVVIDLDEESIDGVDCIGIVRRPAIESGFLKFAAQDIKTVATQSSDVYDLYAYPIAGKPDEYRIVQRKRRSKSKFKDAQADKQILVGAALIPNKLIYRYDETTGEEFYSVWDQTSINNAVEKWRASKDELKRKFNFDHLESYPVEGLVVDELISDGGLIDVLELDCVAGSWIIFVKIDDEYFWEEYVKTGIVTGFSVEAWLGLEPVMQRQTQAKPAPKPAPASPQFVPYSATPDAIKGLYAAVNFAPPVNLIRKSKAELAKTGLKTPKSFHERVLFTLSQGKQLSPSVIQSLANPELTLPLVLQDARDWATGVLANMKTQHDQFSTKK